MRRTMWLVLAVTVAWGAAPARGEEPSPVRMEITLSRRPATVVQPAPDPRILEEDVRKAVTEIQTRERTDELIRETLRAPSRRPDLSYDVWSGIQSRNIHDALRRR